VWDSLADLLKIMKIREVGADDVKEVREIVQHLFTNIAKSAHSKRDRRQAKTHVDNLLLQLVDDMLSMWNTDSFLDRAKEFVKMAIHKHAKYTTAELGRSRPITKGVAIRRRLGAQVAVNMHTMGTRPGLDTVSRSSVHDKTTIATHHRPSLPATTLPVLTARSSRASARQTRDATPLQARWAPDPSNNGHSTSSPEHLSQMTHEETLHAGYDSVRRTFRHTPFHLVERLFPQPTCVRPSWIGAGNGLWNDSEEVIPAFAPIAILACGDELTERPMGQMYFEHDSRGSHPSTMQQWQHSPACSVGRWHGAAANHLDDSVFSIMSVLTSDNHRLGIIVRSDDIPHNTEIGIDYGASFGSMPMTFSMPTNPPKIGVSGAATVHDLQGTTVEAQQTAGHGCSTRTPHSTPGKQ